MWATKQILVFYSNEPGGKKEATAVLWNETETSKLDHHIKDKEDFPGVPVKHAKNDHAKGNDNLQTSAGPSKEAEDVEIDIKTQIQKS